MKPRGSCWLYWELSQYSSGSRRTRSRRGREGDCTTTDSTINLNNKPTIVGSGVIGDVRLQSRQRPS